MNSGITANIIGVQWIVGGQVNFDHTRFAPDFVDFGVLRVNKSAVASVDTIQCTIELDSGEFLTSEEYHLAGDDNCPTPTPVITLSKTSLTTPVDVSVVFVPSTSSTSNYEIEVTRTGNNIASMSNTNVIEPTATISGIYSYIIISCRNCILYYAGLGMHEPPTKPSPKPNNLHLLAILGIVVVLGKY